MRKQKKELEESLHILGFLLLMSITINFTFLLGGYSQSTVSQEDFNSAMTVVAQDFCERQSYGEDRYTIEPSKCVVIDNIYNCDWSKPNVIPVHNFTHGIWLEDEGVVFCHDGDRGWKIGDYIPTKYLECEYTTDGDICSVELFENSETFTLEEVLK